MYRHILCPIDGSQASLAGMLEAIRLAKEQNALLRFIHIIDTYIPIVDMAGDFNVTYMIEILRDNGQKIVAKADIAAKNAGINAGAVIIESVGGRVSALIVAEAEKWPADLIVMGTHGLRGLRRMVMGSDAENVLRASHSPVLMVKSPHAER